MFKHMVSSDTVDIAAPVERVATLHGIRTDGNNAWTP